MDWILIRWRAGFAVRLVLGALWAWSSWVHLSDPHAFLRAVNGYDITPEWLSKGIAYGLPVLGLCLAVLLIIGLVTRWAAALSGLLQVAILIAAVQAWIRGLSNSWGIFGGAGLTDSPMYWLRVLVTLALIAASAYLVRWPLSVFSIDARVAESAILPDASARAMRNPRSAQRHQAQVERRRQQVRNEQLFLGGSVAVLVALICVVGMAVQSQRANEGVNLTAAHANVEDGVVWGSDSAPVTVDLYEDFKCTECAQFQQATAEQLKDLVYAGKLKIHYHPIAYIDVGPEGESSRLANAALCASDISVDTFVTFHNVAFDVGVAGGTPGMDTPATTDSPTPAPTTSAPDASETTPAEQPTNANTQEAGNTLTDRLLALGTKAAISDAAFTACVTGNTHKDLVEAITDEAASNGVTGAPTVLVNGDELSFSNANDLSTKLLASVNEKADDAVAGGKVLEPYTPAASASSTPTPEAS